MNLYLKPLQFFTCASILCIPSLLLAGSQPLFSLIPSTTTALFLPTNSTAIVQYKVINNTQKIRILTMKPITGITQNTQGPSFCNNPFSLAHNQSCLLTLLVDGSQIPVQISGGPEICKTKGPGNNNPDPFLCSQPKQPDLLFINSVAALPEQKAYVTNWNGNSISLCDVSSVDGTFKNCTIAATGSPPFSNPEAIALNPSKTFLYVANITGSVSYCAVDSSTGALTNCSETGNITTGGGGVAINALGTLAYFSDANNNNVSYCQINSHTGRLENCAITGNDFNVPSDLVLNADGTIAYVTNLANSVSICNVNNPDGTLVCPYKIFGFDESEGITLHPSGLFAYVTNNGSNSITLCDVHPYTGLLTNCNQTGGQFDGFGNIAFNQDGRRAYIPRSATNTVSLCEVNQKNGILSNCRDSHGTGFDRPSGILLN